MRTLITAPLATNTVSLPIYVPVTNVYCYDISPFQGFPTKHEEYSVFIREERTYKFICFNEMFLTYSSSGQLLIKARHLKMVASG